MNSYAEEYLSAIKSGDETVCTEIRSVYEREMNWAKNPPKDFQFYYDPERGQRHIEFIERFCKNSKGSIAGRNINLELFQKAKLEMVFGWVEKDTNLRRFREVVDVRGRKCGKSTETAAVEWDVALNDHEAGAEIYCTANKKDQAKLIFNECVNMRTQSSALKGMSTKRQSDIYIPLYMSFIQALASDTSTMDGLNAHFFSLDEFHEQKNSKLYDVMIQSQAFREQPLAWLISTNGFVREGFYDDHITLATNIALWTEGFEDFRKLCLIHKLDDREEWQAPESWAKANPGLGKIKKISTLAEHVEQAKRDPSFLPTLMTKDFNMSENTNKGWLRFDEAVNEGIVDIDYLKNSYAVGGCDLSSTTDLTCATLILMKPEDSRLFCLQKYFVPRSKVTTQEERDAREAPYRIWEERGFLSVADGATVNYHAVTEWFVEMVNVYDIRPLWIGYDAALSGFWREEMESYGFVMEKIRQGPFTWTYPFKELQGLFIDHMVWYQNNPMLRWCLLNTAVKSTNKDGIESQQPVKVTSTKRIDGTVSLLNAYTCLKNHEDEYRSFIK